MPAKSAQKPAGTATAARTKRESFTDDERAAMKERAKELKAAASQADEESALLEKIAEMDAPDRAIAERLHAIIKEIAPDLAPKLWYGMPAYAKDGKLVCFFQTRKKFKTRYATLGFSDKANLDDGAFWPVSYALMELTAAEEKKIVALLKQAVS
jgi:uncharacterized protein YdhG (YjbR/CyaY superfamily)